MTDFKQMLEENGLPTEETQIRQEFEKITDEVGLITNTSRMSPFWRLITAIAVKPVQWLTNHLIVEILPNLFVKTARDKWLQIQAWQVGLDFKDATKAQGVVHFTKESDLTDLTIKAGTVVQTERINDVIFKLIVTENTVIPRGTLTAPVPVVAEYAGTAYNLATDYYRILAENIPGVVKVENLDDWLTQPGSDRETNEELRERYRTQFASVGQHHIDSVYRSMIAKVAGLSVDRIYFKHDAPRGPGTANAYLLLDTGVTSQPFIDVVNNYIQTEGNHGHGDDLICYAMPETQQNITCAIYFDPRIAIGEVRKGEIKQNVENMIRCAFRENRNYQVTKTYPFSRFSWSKLGEEIHAKHSEIDSLVWGQQDIKSELTIPRIQSLTVTVAK
ncbi:baseplate J/gp47 family protein [Pasteurella multocida]|uniref:baseplate J/gp47 family protein n=1 Tax=Pasteurella multocida TaxID=747 RepID=UPI00201FB484|nr:baseplate J/gp47 family protein [Pasteurella multocida]MCL7797926.1 baseplate J/gp47 family protein [Pasteurella multocida]